jgi:hypothetical protein
MHWRTPLLALCLAVLVTTAGCNALGGSGDTAPTTETTTTAETTTPTTTETATTTTRNATSFPPGIARNGSIVNEKALMDAHHRILLEEGAVWHLNRTSMNYSNLSIEQRIATGGETLYRDRNVLPTSQRYTYWANQSIFLSRERAENGTTTYGAKEGLDQALDFGVFMKRATRAAIIDGLTEGNDTQTTLVETKVIDGVRYTTVRVVQKVRTPRYNESAREVITFNASGRGVIQSYEYTYPEPLSPYNGTDTHSFELKQLGNVTVERPDWTSKALNESNETSA